MSAPWTVVELPDAAVEDRSLFDRPVFADPVIWLVLGLVGSSMVGMHLNGTLGTGEVVACLILAGLLSFAGGAARRALRRRLGEQGRTTLMTVAAFIVGWMVLGATIGLLRG